jgi:hypothetical protein
MRTTVRLDDELMKRARRRAAEEGRTLTSLIEEGLKLVIAAPKVVSRTKVELPVSRAGGGVLPGVDLDRSADLEEVMNGR